MFPRISGWTATKFLCPTRCLFIFCFHCSHSIHRRMSPAIGGLRCQPVRVEVKAGQVRESDKTWHDVLIANHSFHRNHPDVIKRRFLSVAIMMVISPLFPWLISAREFNEQVPLLDAMGFRRSGFVAALIIPLLLTMLLFLGPISVQIATGHWRRYLGECPSQLFAHSVLKRPYYQILSTGGETSAIWPGFATTWWRPCPRSSPSAPA